MKDDNGAVVLSKLESATLRDLAVATHGTYRDASEWVDLPALLSSTVDAGRKGRFIEQNTVRYVERYQWALAQALACLIASFLLEFPVQPKPREIRLSATMGPKARAAAVAAMAALLLLPVRIQAADEAAPPDPAASLSKVVGRLSAQDNCSAVDWAEMASETLSWGQHLGAGSQPVPEPPVRDALTAVDQGSSMDPKAADWPHLRSELEKLLQKPDQKNQQQDQKQDQDKKQDQQKDQQKDQKQQGQDQKNQDQKQGQDPQQQNQQQSQPKSANPADSKDQKGQQQDHESGRPKDQKAFGDMNKQEGAAPKEKPSQGATQKVGGVTKDQQSDPAMKNPDLAVSLQKLEQVKNEDSPAELFDLMRRGEPAPPAPDNGKKW